MICGYCGYWFQVYMKKSGNEEHGSVRIYNRGWRFHARNTRIFTQHLISGGVNVRVSRFWTPANRGGDTRSRLVMPAPDSAVAWPLRKRRIGPAGQGDCDEPIFQIAESAQPAAV
jgi:hypothetical protein